MCFQDDAIAQKLAVLSLLEVFKDIIPGYDALTRMTRATHTHTHTVSDFHYLSGLNRYRIRMPTAEEKQMKVSKEVKKVREFEARLLSSYQKYLQKLEKIMKCTLRPTPNRHSHPLPARFFCTSTLTRTPRQPPRQTGAGRRSAACQGRRALPHFGCQVRFFLQKLQLHMRRGLLFWRLMT